MGNTSLIKFPKKQGCQGERRLEVGSSKCSGKSSNSSSMRDKNKESHEDKASIDSAKLAAIGT